MALLYKALALLLFSSAVTLGCVDRNVRVIFEGGDGAEFMLSGIPLRTFLMSGTECWKTSSVSIMDSAKVLIKDAFDLWSKIENGRTVRENVVEELKYILKANGDALHPRDNAPVIVLFLRDNDLNVKDLVAAARDLQETGYKFIVYGIGSKLPKAVFEPIAVASKRVLVAKDFGSVNQNVLKILLKNPDHKFPKTASFSNDAEPENCDIIVDLGFILDSSESVRSNYQDEKNFIKTIAEGFNINKGGSRAGVVTFSHVADLSIPFSDDLTTFQNDVDKIPLMGSDTIICLALEKARDELFNTAFGARPDVKKVLVLLTDGKHGEHGARNPADIAKELRTKLGVELIVIGIGHNINEGELKEITGPSDSFRKASSFTELASLEFVREIKKKICTIAEPENCDIIVDLGFILDSSESVRSNYQDEKNFIKTIAEGFNINKDGSRAGVVTFSHVADLSIPFSDDLTTFQNDVDKIPLMGSDNILCFALEKARDELFNTAFGARPNVKKVLVLLTDGKHGEHGARNPADIAKELRTKLGVELIVIGIGHNINEGELKEITGPSDSFRKASSFTELASLEFVREIKKKICTIVKKKTCHKLVDICFLIDSSGSIDEKTHWPIIKDFVRSLADRFPLSATGSHGAVVVFSDYIKINEVYTKVVLKLDNKMDASSFGQSVMDIPYIGYRTRMDLGFNLVEKEVFVSKNGARAKDVKKIVILITDGKQNPQRYDPVAASQKLYNDKVNIYAVGIGNNVDFEQLKRITRHPHRVFAARDFDSLLNEEFVKNVTKTSCDTGIIREPSTDGCCCGQDDLNKMKDELIKSFEELAAEKMKNKYCKRGCGEQPPPSVGIPSVITNYYRTHKGTHKAV